MANESNDLGSVAGEVAIKAMQDILTVVEISPEDEKKINDLLLPMAEEIGFKLRARRRMSVL